MTLLYQTTSVTTSGVAINLNSGEDLLIASGVLLGSTDFTGVLGLGSAHDVQVYGTVSGDLVGIQLGIETTTDTNNAVRVMSGGSVYASATAITFVGSNNRLTNDGTISADDTGIFIVGPIESAGLTIITNRGTISAATGIDGGNDALLINNHGTIESYEPVFRSAILASNANDTVNNYGTITGNVALDLGNDIYDGRGGTINGIIFGNDGNDKLYAGVGDNELHGDAGNDTLIGGAGEDALNGGAGTDRVSYTSATSGVAVNLSKPELNIGDALGDTYTSIEELAGSRHADSLSGNSLNNRILGLEGNDFLNGSTGNDTLTGGGGNDTFVFTTALNASTNVDTITDFNVVDDRIQLENAIFAGLSTGTLASAAFRANTTGNAADATDRIIYETDTGNLYFDADGDGAGTKILFAKLDAGLSLTNADFLVI